MRSTGAPIKRRQEQETERETGSARPQGPRRYHHCQPLCIHSGACLKITSKPLTSLPFLPHFVFVQAQAVLKPTSGHRCVCPLGAGCVETPQHPHVCVFSSGWPKSQKAWFCNPLPQHCTLTSSSVYVCVCVWMCTFSQTHTLDYIQQLIIRFVFVCLLQCSKKLLCCSLCCHQEEIEREGERVSLGFSVLHCFPSLLLCCSL